MTGTPLDVLGLVGAAAGATRLAGRAVSGIASGQPFADLLGRAQGASGDVAPSGLPVTVAARSGVELSAAQLERVSVAADRAASNGAEQAVVMLDGSAYRLDVQSRQITGVVDRSSGLEDSIDAFVFAPPEAAATPATLPSDIRNPDLLRLLGDRA
ncbi:MAG: hypothetical protein AAGF47_00130 [Planctomycetota bacterium]